MYAMLQLSDLVQKIIMICILQLPNWHGTILSFDLAVAVKRMAHRGGVTMN